MIMVTITSWHHPYQKRNDCNNSQCKNYNRKKTKSYFIRQKETYCLWKNKIALLQYLTCKMFHGCRLCPHIWVANDISLTWPGRGDSVLWFYISICQIEENQPFRTWKPIDHRKRISHFAANRNLVCDWTNKPLEPLNVSIKVVLSQVVLFLYLCQVILGLGLTFRLGYLSNTVQ